MPKSSTDAKGYPGSERSDDEVFETNILGEK
jgi:hypothetical protein